MSIVKIKKICGKITLFLLCLFLPRRFTGPILNVLGWRVSPQARIGFSLIWVDDLRMGEGAIIGGFNIIRVRRLIMKNSSIIRHFNFVRGPLSLLMLSSAVIGRRNEIVRARLGITTATAMLKIGKGAIITASHKIDCTASVKIGDYAIVAGSGSQLWTHGYVHEKAGARYRVDGVISIGENVYVGSRVVITGGVKISEDIIVGAGVTVARDLNEPGMYVSSSLRLLPRPTDPGSRVDLELVNEPELIERVYRKREVRP